MAGTGSSIKNELLEVEIHREDLQPLTFIDLPGYIFFAADQNADQGEETKNTLDEIYNFYLSQPDTTICLVMAATSEPQSSASFPLVKKIDPLF